ncbi:hypothetical protein BD626DRAFT_113689 [Schizophyllum amplum]|uniref:Uncharacterized protein n=1 Tax=Schizophyllum amplum TaxID=97359 RepID=A0A550CU00_9AGAR|nr:hypothetical protein BD626DRAFT_113689 [Auriculariopsis ampla]
MTPALNLCAASCISRGPHADARPFPVPSLRSLYTVIWQASTYGRTRFRTLFRACASSTDTECQLQFVNSRPAMRISLLDLRDASQRLMTPSPDV